MKKRLGFVSNSSSSSFIIGLALVPEGRTNEFKANYPEHVFDLAETVADRNGWGLRYRENGDYLIDEAFDGTEVRLTNINNILADNPEACVISIDECGSDPQYDDDIGEYNYDEIEEDEDWFDEQQLRVADAIRECGGEVYVGGGFNG